MPEVSLGSRLSEDSSEADLLDYSSEVPPEDPQGIFFFLVLAILLNHTLRERASSNSVVEQSLRVKLSAY